jgi:hypothetical protein
VLRAASEIFIVSLDKVLLVAAQTGPLPENSKNGHFVCVTDSICDSDFCPGCNVPVLGNLLDAFNLNLGDFKLLESESE